MEQVDAAEKEASEVLHSLLSVERIEKQPLISDTRQQVVVVTSGESAAQPGTLPSENGEQNEIQWHTPVTVHHTLFTNMVGVNQAISGDQVIWQLNEDTLTSQQQNTLYMPSVPTVPTTQTETSVSSAPAVDSSPVETQKKNSKNNKTSHIKRKVKVPAYSSPSPSNTESSHLEESAQEVRARFEKGCECQEDSCFKGLNPDYVYRHRLNIAELTKGEHDMYLMGVTMAVLTNPEETVRHKERRRLRAQYVFQGRRVCLDAFLYLENCTHYQLKRIRKHVMTHGVAPRVHGNHGKKPHNTFPLDSYRHAASFLREFIERHSPGSAAQPLNSLSNKGKAKSTNKTAPLYLPSEITRKTIHDAYRDYCEHFEPSIKVMGYSTFRQYMKEQFPHVKFCKLEGGANKSNSSQHHHHHHHHHHNQNQIQQQQQQCDHNDQAQQHMQQDIEQHMQQGIEQHLQQDVEQHMQQDVEQHMQQDVEQRNSAAVEVEIVGPKLQADNIITHPANDHQHHESQATAIISASDVQQVTAIPIVLSQSNSQNNTLIQSSLPQPQSQQQQQQQTAYIVTPVSQILQSAMGHGPNIGNPNGNTFASYQLTSNAANRYTTHQSVNHGQVSTITLASVQNSNHPGSYAFTTL